MPAVLTYPGVYIEEVPSGVRTIAGVATSVAAFVGRAKLGPDNVPVVINSWADFERRFGGLWDESPLTVAVRDFFQNGGGQAVIVRVFSPTLAGATDAARVAADATATAAEDAVAAAANAQAVADAAKVQADTYAADSPAAVAAAAVFKAADDLAKGAGNADKKQETADAARGAVDGAATDAAGAALDKTVARFELGTLKLKASSPGAWANDLRARIDLQGGGGLFMLTLRDSDTGAIEQFSNLSLDSSHARRADKVLKRESMLVRLDGALPGGTPVETQKPAAGKQWWEDAASSVGVAAGKDATDGDEISDAVVEGSEAAKTGVYALDEADDINLLCIPPHKFEDGDIGSGLIDAAIAYCVKRRAILLIDPPSGWKTKDAASAGIDGSAVGSPSANAAIYFPRILRPSPFPADAGAFKAYAPCGAVAGVMARTDTDRGVWKAPAGLDADAHRRAAARRLADRCRERRAQSDRHQLPAHLPGGGARRLGRADAGAAPTSWRRMEIPAGPAHRALHRGEPLSRHQVGRVRAQRRAALGVRSG